MRRRFLVLGFLLTPVLVIAACGSGGDNYIPADQYRVYQSGFQKGNVDNIVLSESCVLLLYEAEQGEGQAAIDAMLKDYKDSLGKVRDLGTKCYEDKSGEKNPPFKYAEGYADGAVSVIYCAFSGLLADATCQSPYFRYDSEEFRPKP